MNNTTTTTIEPEILRKETLAKMLDITPRMVQSWRKSGKLPPSKRTGKYRYWKRSDIQKWISWGRPNIERFIENTEGIKRNGF